MKPITPRSNCLVPLVLITSLIPVMAHSQSYPVKLENSISFDSLSITCQRLSLRLGKGGLSRIECEKGITGVAVSARGTFSYVTDDTVPIHDDVTGLMLRFDPSEYEVFIKPLNEAKDERPEIMKESREIFEQSFHYLYHKGKEALLPSQGILAGVLYGLNLGALVVHDGGDEKPFVFQLKERRYLFEGSKPSLALSFRTMPKNWIQQPNRQSMNAIWSGEGMNVKGENYYYLPAPIEGKTFSQRFDPTSPYFQSWFGIYVVKDNESKRFAFADGRLDGNALFQLAVADQRAWLRNVAGLDTPVVAVDTSFPIAVVKVSVAGQDAWKLTGRVRSNVDVGEKNVRVGRPDVLLIPSISWSEYIGSYASVTLDVVAYVLYNSDKKETYVIYYNGIDFIDKKGQHHRTLPDIQAEMEPMMSTLTLEKE